MPRCSTSILLHSAGGALVRPIARTRYTHITYHTTRYHIPHDEYTAAGRPRAGGRRRGTRGPVIGGGALVTTEKKKIKPTFERSNKQTLKTRPPSTFPFPFAFSPPLPTGDSSSVRVAARSGETSDAALLFVWPDGRPRGVYSSRDDDENLAASSSGPRPRASREIRIRSRWRALEGDLRSGEETFLGRLPSSRRRPHPFVGLAARPTANHFMIEPGWRRPPLTPRLQPARSYQRVSVGAQTTPRHQPMNKAHGSSWQ